ncbi:hypothetical protein AB0F15_33180 [Amycolatopsis sp. NPDC026612]|uniref:hypothetical protein n=1 Tax=Amycolatopsis sp. NPDC026612 TaxID=3155466 RepID=UPI0033CA8317
MTALPATLPGGERMTLSLEIAKLQALQGKLKRGSVRGWVDIATKKCLVRRDSVAFKRIVEALREY